jgi:hypothetical protein
MDLSKILKDKMKQQQGNKHQKTQEKQAVP